VTNKLNAITNWEKLNINEKEEAMRTAVSSAAKIKLGTKPSPTKTAWVDDECKEAVRLKKLAFMRYLQRPTRNSHKEYKARRQEVIIMARAEKRQHLKDEILLLETKGRNNETRQFYNLVKSHNKDTELKSLRILNEGSDTILSAPDEVLSRWRQYFEGLLNEQNVDAHQWEVPEVKAEVEDEPDYQEVEKVIRGLKNCKAPGEDRLVAELLKKWDSIVVPYA
jgi:hypothetical protein